MATDDTFGLPPLPAGFEPVDPGMPSIAQVPTPVDVAAPKAEPQVEPQPWSSRAPAAVRLNNPGAMYPGPSASKFGSTEYEIIGGGHKAAVFSDPVNGAAAQFDLLDRSYTGMPLYKAIKKWSGGNSSAEYTKKVAEALGMSPYDVLTSDVVRDPARAIPLAKAAAKWEAGKEYPLSDEQWSAAHSRAFGSGADSLAGGTGADNLPPLPAGFTLIDEPAKSDLPPLPKGFSPVDDKAADKKSATFMESVGRGVDQMQGMLYGGVEALGELTGSKGMTGFGREGRVRNDAEAKAYGDAAEFTKIRTAGDFGQWVKETVGSQIPVMAPMLAGGAAGAAIGSVVPVIGTTLGGIIGAFAPGFVMSTGETQGNIKEKDPNAVAPGSAFVGGAAIAALDSVLPGRVGSALVRKFGAKAAEEIAEAALKKEVKDGFIKRNAKGVAVGMATEGLTESLQEAIGDVAAAYGTGKPLDPNLGTKMIEAGAAGALLGGIMGPMQGGGSPQAPEGEEPGQKKVLALPPPPASQAVAETPPASSSEVATLKAMGYSDQAIAEMTPEERAAEVAGAPSMGVTTQDAPTAEPVKDITAQIGELASGNREGVYLSPDNVANVQSSPEFIKAIAEALGQTKGAELVDNVDGKGGILIAKDKATGEAAKAAIASGTDPQAVLGAATGAGTGKEANADTVVQQKTPDDAVTRESVVPAADAPRVAADMEAPGKTVKVTTLPDAIARREQELAAEKSATQRVVGNTPEFPTSFRPEVAPVGDGSRAKPVKVEIPEDVAVAGQRVAEPTEAQKEANNYAHGHVKLHGLDISIETPKGAVRRGKGWENVSPAAYGYFKGVPARAKDKEHVDVYVGDDVASDRAFIVDQYDLAGKFDEPKVILGVNSSTEAAAIYDAGFSDKSGPKRRRGVSNVSIDELKQWLKTGDATKPFARAVKNARVLDVAENALPLPQGGSSRLPDVRRAGDQGVPGVGGELPKVPGGYGAEADARTLDRPQGRDEGLQPEQLQVGDARGASAEPTGVRPSPDSARTNNDRGRMGSKDRDQADNAVRQDQEGDADRNGAGVNRSPTRGTPNSADVARQDDAAQSVGEGEKNTPVDDKAETRQRVASRKGADEVAEAPETGPSDSGPSVEPLSPAEVEAVVKAWRYVKAVDDAMKAGKSVQQERIDQANELDADLYDYGITLEDFPDESSLRQYLSGGGEGVVESAQGGAQGEATQDRPGQGESGAPRSEPAPEPAGKDQAGEASRDEVGAEAAGQPSPASGVETVDRISRLSLAQVIEVAKAIGMSPGSRPTLSDLSRRIARTIIEAGRDGAKAATTSEISGPDVDRAAVAKAAEAAKARQIAKINAAIDDVLKPKPAQSSLVPDATTSEKIAAEAKAKSEKGKAASDDAGPLFNPDAGKQGDLVDLAKKPVEAEKPTSPKESWVVVDTNTNKVIYRFETQKEARDWATTHNADEFDGTGRRNRYMVQRAAVRDILESKPVEADKKPGTPKAETKETAAEKTDREADSDPLAPLVVVLRGAGFKTIIEARKFVREAGILPEGASNKQIDETIEAAVVRAAREIVAEGKAPAATFKRLIDLYNAQPNLASRTGTSVANQAYSTPMPLAYVASRLAGVQAAAEVYEPTAGNGALLIEADPAKTYANEIDPDRAKALKAQGFTVTSKDGAEVPSLTDIESVIMNPPFGAVKEGGASKVFELGDLATTKIDHAIALNALEAMSGDGKAVLIIGGTKAESVQERTASYRGMNMRDAKTGKGKDNFYRVLYDRYNVTDHFTVSGDLYTKQGASWPVDVIVIDGRGKSQRPLPGTPQGVPALLKSWDELAEKIPNDAANDRAGDRPARKPVERDGGSAARDEVRGEPDVGDRPVSGKPEAGAKPAAVRKDASGGQPEGGRGDAVGQGDVPAGGRGDGGRVDRDRAPRRERVKVEEGATQAKYAPVSGSLSVDTLVPASMADASRNAMERVEQVRGNVDDFVRDALGYEADADGMFFLRKNPETGVMEKQRPFSAEQIDAIALAIDNVERGDAIVVGDATGIGKGRVGAGMLRYAMKKGLVPVLMTEKMDLYGDMYRDMRDIGMFEMLGREPRILTTDVGKSIPLDEEAVEWKADAELAEEAGQPLPKRRGKFLSGGSAPAKDKAYDRLLAGDADVADVVFTTYSQMQTLGEGKAVPRRRSVLDAIAPRAMMVLDEVHNAGGQGVVDDARGKKAAEGGRAEFVRNLTSKAKGLLFMSATYAKRPNVMDLYARTDMGKAVEDIKDLPRLIQRGGVPMQQIVASMLAESGQYLRRERSFEGIEYAVEEANVDETAYDQFVGSVQSIFKFDLAVKDVRDEIIEEILNDLGAGTKGQDGGIGEASARSTGFASIMHNIVSQMLLAIKANAAAERAITSLKAGEKPVVTLALTNESFISDFAEMDGTTVGQPLNIDFGDMLKRYLQRTLRITYKKAGDKKPSHYQIPVERLPASLQQAYRTVEFAIDQGNYAGMPVSPIDWIRHKITEAGYTVREITGRKTMLDYGRKTPTLVARPKGEAGSAGKRVTISKFNSGTLDAVILNQSGSTGVSMHASEKFKDQRKRRMILAQAEANIDTHMQMLGRVNRTGQVNLPAYSQLAASIPAEVRPIIVLMRKMASLSANTTGARGSAFSAEAADFLNEVGDKVMAEYLWENPEINVALGEPYDGVETKDVVQKATGKLVLLTVAQQREMLETVQKNYIREIEQLDALGENPLEAKLLDLQAETLESSELKPKTGDSPFLDAVRMEKVSAKAQGRAMPISDVAEKISDALKTAKPEGSEQAVLEQLERKGRDWLNNETRRVQDLARRQIADELAETKPDSREGVRSRLLAQMSRWQQTMNVAYPGARVSLAMPSGNLDGIVMSVERSGKAKSITALSAWTVKVAVPDSARQFEFPMSKLFPPGVVKSEDEKGAAISRSGTSTSALITSFDEARKEGRETRYIVTGNILGGYDQTKGKGRIVNFTTNDGQVRPGVLMERGFELEKFMGSRAIRFQTGDQVARFVDSVSDVEVTGRDAADLVIGKNRGSYFIQMAKARGKAGKYYTDKAVRGAIAPKEFEARGNKMMAEGLTRAELVAAIDEMKKIGAAFETTVAQDEAQKIIGESAAPSAAISSRSAVANVVDDVEDAVLSGKTYRVAKDRVSAQHEAIKPLLKIVPKDAVIGVLERIVPETDSAIDPLNWTVTAEFRLPDGKLFELVGVPRSWLLDNRAFALPPALARKFSGGRPAILFNNLGAHENLGGTTRGEVWHEGLHILWSHFHLSADSRAALLRHARSLRVLDMPARDFFALIGDPEFERVAAGVTLRDLYAKAYKNRRDIVDIMRQEEVSHLLELYSHGAFSDDEMVPVQSILDDIERGAVSDNESFGQPVAEDVLAALDSSVGQSMRRELDALGYYSKALESARALKQAKGTPAQMLAQLKKAGVKDAEIEATGLKSFLNGKGSTTRDEIVGHLEANRIGLREVKRTGSAERGVRAADLERRARDAEDRGDTDAANRLWNESEALLMDAGDAKEPKWAAYSLDPSNPTYRETVLHLPSYMEAAQARLNAALSDFKSGRISATEYAKMGSNTPLDFASGHFPEPNIVGHMMTSMVRLPGSSGPPLIPGGLRTKGKADATPPSVFLIDQVQSDWGQKLRDGGVRDEAKIAELRRLVDQAAAKEADEINRLYAENPTRKPVDIVADVDAALGAETKRLKAELNTAEAAAPGNPLVNTTDQWVNTVLRRAIRQAAEANADYIAIPTGDTVLSYNPGDEKGMQGFYGEIVRDDASGDGWGFKPKQEGIVPKNLRKLLKAFDKDAPPPIHEYTLDSPSGKTNLGAGFTIFPLTNVVKWAVKAEGQPLFSSVPGKNESAVRDIEKAINNAVEIVGRIAGQGVDVRMAERIPRWQFDVERPAGAPRDPGGVYQRPVGDARALITLAYADPSYDVRTTAGHEAYHHVETVLATPREMNLLRSPSEMERATRLAATETGRTVEETRKLPDYEIRAVAFQRYRRMRDEGMPTSGIHIGVRRVWDAMVRLARGVRNVLRGQGFDSMEAVFERARTGEMASRVQADASAQRVGAQDAAQSAGAEALGSTVPRDIMTNPAFRAWFGNSKVVIEDGKRKGRPLPVYRGRQEQWSVMPTGNAAQLEADLKKAGLINTDYGRRELEHARRLGDVSWFTDDAGTAAGYRDGAPSGDILEAYLSLQNPLDLRLNKVGADRLNAIYKEIFGKDAVPVTTRMENAHQIVWDNSKVVQYAREHGYDGLVHDDTDISGRYLHTSYVAFSPTQIKSMENAGSFDAQNPDIMASFFPTATSRGTFFGRKTAAIMRRMAPLSDAWRVRLQDKMLPVRREQEAIEGRTGAGLPLPLDVYVAEALYHGRAGEKASDLQQKHIEPLVEFLRKNGIDGDQLGDYLAARHAPERNAYIRTIDPSNDSGSGMTDAEARAAVSRVENGPKAQAYAEAARMAEAINKQTRDLLLSSGLISRETYDAWETQYQHYVPLRGFEISGDEEQTFPRVGKGFDIRGPEARQALGRRTKSDNPLAYIILQAQQAIVRAEKNRVNKTLMRLVEQHPDPDVWQVYRGEYRRKLNEQTGQVETVFVPPQFSQHDPSIVGVKIGGKQHYIKLESPGLARAMRGIGSSEFDHAIVRNMMALTRTYAQLLTSWNPEFVVGNYFRDVQTALMNSKAVADLPEGARKRMIAEALSLKSIRGIYNALRGDGSAEYARHFEEFRQAGGKISFMEYNDVERIKRRIEGMLKTGKMADVGRALRQVGKFVEDVNTSVENGVRLSTYVAMRNAGIPQDRAAFVARELTVNFNRKGEWGPIINSAYMFFNASVQGSVRMLQALRSPAVQRAVLAIIAGGAGLELLNYMIAGNDDDGENAYEKIKPWVKERNMIFMLPGRKDYMMIPMPYGYNIFYNTGRVISELGRTVAGHGKLTPAKAASQIGGSIASSFNPLGEAGSLSQMFTPTLLDPVLQVSENKTWYGGPIYPTKYDRKKPDSENYFSTVHPAFIAAAKWLNSTTGGNAARSGVIDVSPEVLEHYAQFAGGGVAKFVLNAHGTGHRLLSGEEWVPEKTPIVRRLYGAQGGTTSRRSDFFEKWNEVDAAHYEATQLAKAGDQAGAAAVRQKHAAEIQAYNAMKGVQKQLSELSKESARVRLSKSLSDAEKEAKIKEIKERENKIILRALEVYSRAQKSR